MKLNLGHITNILFAIAFSIIIFIIKTQTVINRIKYLDTFIYKGWNYSNEDVAMNYDVRRVY